MFTFHIPLELVESLFRLLLADSRRYPRTVRDSDILIQLIEDQLDAQIPD